MSAYVRNELLTRLKEASAWKPGSEEINRVRIIEYDDGSWDVAIVIDGRYFERATADYHTKMAESWRKHLKDLLAHIRLIDGK